MFFEVKEFDATPADAGYGTYKPYKAIEAKISEAKEQFKEYKEFPCSLVLANLSEGFVNLDSWAIYGAMLGSLGFKLPLQVERNGHASANVFLSGGKMVNGARKEPWNTTFSTIVVVGTYPLSENVIRLEIKKRQSALGRMTTSMKDLAVWGSLPDSDDLRRVRVYVYENPYARIPLSRDLFNGPFDQRWGTEGPIHQTALHLDRNRSI